MLVGRGDRIVYQKAIGHRAVSPAAEPMTTRHDLRPRVADQGRGDDDQRDEARGGRTDPAQRAGLGLHPGVRASQQDQHHDPPPDDAHVRPAGRISIRRIPGPAPTRRSSSRWRKRRRRRRASGSSTATSTTSCSATSSGASAACRSTSSRRKHIFEPLGMKDTMFLPPAVAAAADRADRAVHRVRLAVRRARREDDARRRARLDRAAHGRRRRPRRVVQHGGRPGDLLPHAPGRRHATRASRILSPLTVAKMTTPASAPGDPNVRGLGWDIDSSFSSNRGELLPIGSFGHTGFTGHVALDRSGDEDVRRVPVEPRASRRQGGRDAASRARRDGRGVGDHRCAVRGGPRPPDDRPRFRSRRRRRRPAAEGRRCRPASTSCAPRGSRR